MSNMFGLLSYIRSDRTKAAEPMAKENETEVKQQPVQALPASWYTSPEMYIFERRAVFSNRWLLMTSTLRFHSAGSYLRYRFAGFDIIIIRNREDKIEAFHNFSKQTRQKLFDDENKDGSGHANLAGVSTTADNVFSIHVRIDRNGFIWINMDAHERPEILFDKYFKNVDIQERYSNIDFKNYRLDHVYTLEAHYNWKIAADNFNECYHCPTTHPDIPAFLNLDSFDSTLKDGHIQHACSPTQKQIDLGVNVHSTYYFPNVSMTVGKHFLMIQKFFPHSPSASTSHYEIFKAKTSTEEEFHLIADMYERVMREDKVLCNNAQANLNRGVFSAGLLHPRYEKAPIFFQQNCREAVNEHWNKEKREGREIYPAGQFGLGSDSANKMQ